MNRKLSNVHKLSTQNQLNLIHALEVLLYYSLKQSLEEHRRGYQLLY
jgi:hypothetical protein